MPQPTLSDKQIRILAALRMGVTAALATVDEDAQERLNIANKATDVLELIKIIDSLTGTPQ